MNLQVHLYQKDYCYPINHGWLRRFGLWFKIVNKNVNANFFPPELLGASIRGNYCTPWIEAHLLKLRYHYLS